MAEPLLHLRGLYKAYGALTVTDGVDLDVLAGETHAVIGPNGAGKTTLIGEISGEIAPDAGRILFAGADVTAEALPARARRGIARSFQITRVLPGFSARDNVALAAQARAGSSFSLFGRADAEPALNAEADRWLERVGLAARGPVPAGDLAHGEKRLLELAIALALKPRLLLLDEPLAGTGHEEAAVLVALIGSLKRELTILLVEHDMEAVFALADRVSVLTYGKILATGTPAAVRADPAVQAAYLGELA